MNASEVTSIIIAIISGLVSAGIAIKLAVGGYIDKSLAIVYFWVFYTCLFVIGAIIQTEIEERFKKRKGGKR